MAESISALMATPPSPIILMVSLKRTTGTLGFLNYIQEVLQGIVGTKNTLIEMATVLLMSENLSHCGRTIRKQPRKIAVYFYIDENKKVCDRFMNLIAVDLLIPCVVVQPIL
jgi:hypothetical protein